MIPLFKRNSLALSLGLIAFILVFSLNLSTNLFLTSLTRGIISFIIFYLLGSLLYFIIYTSGPNEKDSIHYVNLHSDSDLDLNEIYQTSKSEVEAGQNKEKIVDFQPLELKKIELSD